MKNIKDAVDRTIKNMRNSVIGTITSIIKSDKTVYAKITDEEIRDIKIMSHYGFFSLPLNGQMGQIIFNNTSKKASIIGVEHDKVPVQLEPGEAIIYCNSGSHILLKDGKIFITGDLNVKGNIIYSGNITRG